MRLKMKERPNLLSELIGIYLNEPPNFLRDLEEAIIGIDAAALQKAAHSLKSISGQMGAHSALQPFVKNGRPWGASNAWRGLQQYCPKTAREYERVVAALKIECPEE